ncbi:MULTISPECIES: SatD family protein [Actinomycetes]|uniref:DNA-binding protein n=2 Tax=Actinomycetes TaxID=1760 RepID=A0ABP6LS02_9MICC
MIIMTLDQKDSRRQPDLVNRVVAELDAMAGPHLVRRFQRTAGDEVQGVLDDAQTVLEIALAVARTEQWSTGIGIGAVRTPLPEETRAGSGPAFEAARDAVTRAKRASGGVALTASDAEAAEQAEALVQLLCELERRRTDSSQEAGKLVDEGLSQSAAAEELGTSQQAVSRRLQRGLWTETRRVLSVAAGIMKDMDATDGVDVTDVTDVTDATDAADIPEDRVGDGRPEGEA